MKTTLLTPHTLRVEFVSALFLLAASKRPLLAFHTRSKERVFGSLRKTKTAFHHRWSAAACARAPGQTSQPSLSANAREAAGYAKTRGVNPAQAKPRPRQRPACDESTRGHPASRYSQAAHDLRPDGSPTPGPRRGARKSPAL